MLLPDAFTPLWAPPPRDLPAGLWFVFRGRDLLVRVGPRGPELPPGEPGGGPPRPVGGPRCFGLLGSAPCWAGVASADGTHAGAAFVPLRDLFDQLEDGL